MTADLAERRVKSLQKQVLLEIEAHPVYEILEPDAFNALRKRVFRGTFEAYRLGVVGQERGTPVLASLLFGWLDTLDGVDPYQREDLMNLVMRTALEAHRTGVLVAATRSSEYPHE